MKPLYKNGRGARIGDHVVGRDANGHAIGGVVVMLEPPRVLASKVIQDLPCVLLENCLHVDDALGQNKTK